MGLGTSVLTVGSRPARLREPAVSIAPLHSDPDGQGPPGEPFARRVRVTGEPGTFILLNRILFNSVRPPEPFKFQGEYVSLETARGEDDGGE